MSSLLEGLREALAPQHEVERELASGGMGTVFLARDTMLDRRVAVKVLKPEEHAAVATKRFLREARILASLRHPNVVSVHHAGEFGGCFYYTMDYIDGETLEQRLAREAMSDDDVVKLGVALLEALEAAHEHGVVHRDIKPSNVFLEGDRVLLGDFGIAKHVDAPSSDVTSTGHRLGTPGYMPPEQVAGEATASTDLYAVGMVLYEAFSGRKWSILDSLSEATWTGIPPPMVPVLRRTLAWAQDDRWMDAAEFRHALEAVHERPGGFKGVLTTRNAVLGTAALGLLAVLLMNSPLLRGRAGTEGSGVTLPVFSKSIAVLPFVNLSGDSESEYFSDGITDDITTQLAKIRSFRVFGHHTTMAYKGSGKATRQIGQELGVDAILLGTVRLSGDRVRVNSQLMDGRDEALLWAEDYERQQADLFALQADIAYAIAGELGAELAPGDSARIEKKPTENIKAHNLYLRGRYFWNRRTKVGFTTAIDYFRRALAEDPSYAAAYAGLADAYVLLGDYSFVEPRGAFSNGKEAVVQALAIDSTLAEAHTALALVRWKLDWDLAGAESSFLQAIQLNPSYATAFQWYGGLLRDLGRHDEALEMTRVAMEIDPLSLIINRDLGRVYFVAGEYDRAVEQLQRTLEMDSRFIPARLTLGLTYAQQGRYTEAIEEFQAAVELSGSDPRSLSWLGYTYALAGQPAEALELLERLVAMSEDGYVEPIAVARINLGLGEIDQTFEWLDRAAEAGSSELHHLYAWPMYEDLRPDPRFSELVARIGFR